MSRGPTTSPVVEASSERGSICRQAGRDRLRIHSTIVLKPPYTMRFGSKGISI